MHRIVLLIGALALMWGLAGPIAVEAETPLEPAAAPATGGAALPPPTVLRGSPLATAKPVPTCPPGYTVSPGYGCLAASGDYTAGWPGYDYWPDYGYSYPFGGFTGFGRGSGRFHGLPGRTISAASTVSWVSTMQLGSAVSAPGADIWVALAGGNCSGTVNLFGRGQLDLRDWASYVGVLPAWSPNPAEWSPISKSSRCQADNETHGYDDRPDPLGRDAETAKQRYIVGSSPM